MISLQLSLSKASAATRQESLPKHIIEVLAKDRPFWRDLKPRLTKLPVVPYGKYIGKLPKQSPHENARAVAKKYDLDLYVGYIITRGMSSKSPFEIHEHSFCVKQGKVIEPTEIENFNVGTTLYCGFKVPDKDVAKGRYLDLFQRMSYILDHSPLSFA